MANNDMDRVVPLGQLDDFKVADGDPDVRGWEVLASDGRKIGEVDELLVDTSAMKVRYLDVDVDDGVIGDGMDRHVLIPIGYARLEQERDCVLVDGLAAADLNALPAYDQGPLTRDFESSVRDSFSRRGTASAAGMMDAGAGMVDTVGMDNTPGTGTALGMMGTTAGAGLSAAGTGTRDETRARNEGIPDGEGLRAAGYDLDGETTRAPLSSGSSLRDTGSPLGGNPGSVVSRAPDVRDTGSLRTGTGRELGTTGGMSAASTADGPVFGGGGGDRLSAGSTSGPGVGGGGGAPMSAGPTTDGPWLGGGSSGMAGSDYLHNADEDFYASDAFDDDRFYGARRGGLTDDVGGGMRGGGADLRSPGSGLRDGTDDGLGTTGGGMRAGGLGGPDGGGAASREEVRDLAQDASQRLREDHQNRGVGGSGSL